MYQDCQLATDVIKPSKMQEGYWYIHTKHQTGCPFLVIDHSSNPMLIFGPNGREWAFFSGFYGKGGCRAVIGHLDDDYVNDMIKKFNDITAQKREEQQKQYPDVSPFSDVMLELRYCEHRPSKVEIVRYRWDAKSRTPVLQEPVYSKKMQQTFERYPGTDVFECKMSKQYDNIMEFACPYCGEVHSHGAIDGTRVSHCSVNRNGYVVLLKDRA